MNQDMIRKVLALHSIASRLTSSGDIQAYDVVVDVEGRNASHWVTVTGWNTVRLYRWMGY